MREVLPLSLQFRICDELDLQAVLALRTCSRAYLELATKVLTRKLHEVVQPFVSQEEAFVACLDSNNAFIWGDGAMSFLLRDEQITVDTLQVSVDHEHWQDLLNHLATMEDAYEVPCPLISPTAADDWAARHGAESVITMRTPTGDIHIYRTASHQSDPLTPVVRAWASLHISYVNGLYFGTGYPPLLFQHKALLSDGDPDDTYTTKLYIDRGFDIRLTARAWPEFRDANHPCPAHRWACTAQARSLADHGALRCRVDPLQCTPLYTTAIWRLDCRPCGGTCLMDGLGILREWQLFDSL